MRLDEITPEMVNRAVEIYLQHAYSDDTLRQAHAVRYEADEDIERILATWEREGTSMRAYTLRLGCEHYPHMKLALWEAYRLEEFVFAVDRHDGFHFDNTGPGYEGWLGVKSKNFRARRAIEDAFYAAGLPTMRYLKEEQLTGSEIRRQFGGHEVLIVENDPDASAIMSAILQTAGFGSRIATSLSEVQGFLQDETARGHCGMALVDLLLADGSGLQVVKALREEPATKKIPILLTSAMNPGDVSVGEADGYLHKPYAAERLIETVEAALRRQMDPPGKK